MPDREEIPSREDVIDATVNIQAFVFNIFACCDNLTWVWVLEKGFTERRNPVKTQDGWPRYDMR